MADPSFCRQSSVLAVAEKQEMGDKPEELVITADKRSPSRFRHSVGNMSFIIFASAAENSHVKINIKLDNRR